MNHASHTPRAVPPRTAPATIIRTLSCLFGFAALSAAAAAQEPAWPARPSTPDITDARDTPRKYKDEWAKRLRPQFQALAKYYADVVAHPLVYRVTQDPSKLPKTLTPEQVSIDERIRELDRLLLEPNPALRKASDDPTPRVNTEHADYIREFGAALDAAFKPLIEKHPEPVVRVNAMRFYAAFCRTGAEAHWPTVTALLTNQNTRTEVKYYALQAAGNLLSAYDVNDYKGRRHAIGSKQPRAAADKEIGALVKAVEDCVTNPGAVVAGIPEGKAESATPDQLEVVRFVRRHAIKALGQVRFVTLPGPDGKPLYPAHTLVRVCMADPTLVPAPGPAECAEAVIGLCNMAPTWDGAPVKGFNPDALAEAVATGLVTFASRRAADPLDRSLPWRGYSLRLADAFRGWRPLFDPLFEATAPNKFDAASVPPVVNDLITRVQASILAPMDKVDAAGKPDLAAAVDVGALRVYLKTLQDKPGRTGQLINGVPATALPAPAAPKK